MAIARAWRCNNSSSDAVIFRCDRALVVPLLPLDSIPHLVSVAGVEPQALPIAGQNQGSGAPGGARCRTKNVRNHWRSRRKKNLGEEARWIRSPNEEIAKVSSSKTGSYAADGRKWRVATKKTGKAEAGGRRRRRSSKGGKAWRKRKKRFDVCDSLCHRDPSVPMFPEIVWQASQMQGCAGAWSLELLPPCRYAILRVRELFI